MTTAARPTFDPAKGGSGRGEKDLSAITRQYSSRDLPGHTKLKYREPGQGTVDEHKSKDYRGELEERERMIQREKEKVRLTTILLITELTILFRLEFTQYFSSISEKNSERTCCTRE